MPPRAGDEQRYASAHKEEASAMLAVVFSDAVVTRSMAPSAYVPISSSFAACMSART